MKKLALLFACILCITLTACNGRNSSSHEQKLEKRFKEEISISQSAKKQYMKYNGYKAAISGGMVGQKVTYTVDIDHSPNSTCASVTEPFYLRGVSINVKDSELNVTYRGKDYTVGNNILNLPVNLIVQVPEMLLQTVREVTPELTTSKLLYTVSDVLNMPDVSFVLALDNITLKPVSLEINNNKEVISLTFLSFEGSEQEVE